MSFICGKILFVEVDGLLPENKLQLMRSVSLPSASTTVGMDWRSSTFKEFYMSGFLYIIQGGDYYKIGVANDVQKRMSELQTGSPHKLVLLGSFEYEDVIKCERIAHKLFSKNRVYGEWFSFEKEELETIIAICSAADKFFSIMSNPQDYGSMFATGWRMATQGRNSKYWNWRRGANNEESIYGGLISELPLPLKDMRKKYGKQNFEVDGELVIPVTSNPAPPNPERNK